MGSRDQELSGTHAKSPQRRSLNLWSGAWAGALRGRSFLGAGLVEYVAFAAFRGESAGCALHLFFWSLRQGAPFWALRPREWKACSLPLCITDPFETKLIRAGFGRACDSDPWPKA